MSLESSRSPQAESSSLPPLFSRNLQFAQISKVIFITFNIILVSESVFISDHLEVKDLLLLRLY